MYPGRAPKPIYHSCEAVVKSTIPRCIVGNNLKQWCRGPNRQLPRIPDNSVRMSTDTPRVVIYLFLQIITNAVDGGSTKSDIISTFGRVFIRALDDVKADDFTYDQLSSLSSVDVDSELVGTGMRCTICCNSNILGFNTTYRK